MTFYSSGLYDSFERILTILSEGQRWWGGQSVSLADARLIAGIDEQSHMTKHNVTNDCWNDATRKNKYPINYQLGAHALTPHTTYIIFKGE